MQKIKKLILLLCAANSTLAFEEDINISSAAYGTVSTHYKIIDGKLDTSEKIQYSEINLVNRTKVSKIVMNISANIGKLSIYDKDNPNKQYSVKLTGKEEEILIPVKNVEFKTICIEWISNENGNKTLDVKEVYIYIKKITPITPIDAFVISPSS
jgi:hypothetical protein